MCLALVWYESSVCNGTTNAFHVRWYCCVPSVGWRYVLAQRLDNCQEVPGGGLSVVGQAGRMKHEPGTSL